MTTSPVHATTRVCLASVAQALAHLGTGAGLSRWNLGLWNCREVEPGLFTGESLFDGATGLARVLVDVLIGAPAREYQACRPQIVAS